ncbi:MAG TPA: cytochrome c [Dongiaceae bacterium]|nr:cytochrome c [Dongiaceae bacterium]
MKIRSTLVVIASLACIGQVHAEAKPEDIIKARQAAYSYLAWNAGKIKAQVESADAINKEEVVRSANAIQAVANSGLGALYVKGTEKGVGFHESKLKPEAFDPAFADKLSEAGRNFNKEANALAQVAVVGDKSAIKAQFGKLGETCKGCHDNFRVKNN